MRMLKILAVSLVSYIAIGLTIDGLIGYFQPQSEDTIVLHSVDADGESIATVLSLRDDDGQWWVESGHWFRGWYHRVLANPNVRVVHDDVSYEFVATPVQTDEAVENMTRLMGKGQGGGYWFGRAMLMFAPIKPVRLDPVSE